MAEALEVGFGPLVAQQELRDVPRDQVHPEEHKDAHPEERGDELSQSPADVLEHQWERSGG